MGTEGISTAGMNFLYARRRVQKKRGEGKTGKVPPTTALAIRRGGPRPGPGRELFCPTSELIR